MFSSEMPDIQGLIKKLDMMDENVNKAVREGLKDGADIIMKEQKRLIVSKSQRLADSITKSRVYANKKNQLGVQTGYQAGAFKEEKDGKTPPGRVGMILEFGRPGQKGKTEITQTRTKTQDGEKVKVKVKVKNGKIEPVPHIRRGFDTKKEEAVNTVAEGLEKAVEKTLES